MSCSDCTKASQVDGSMKGNMKLNLEEIATKGFLMEMGSTIIGLSNQKKLPQNFPLEGPRRGPRSTPGGPWGVNFKKKNSLKGGSIEISMS